MDIGDLTFATSTGSLDHSGSGTIVTSMPYGVPMSCTGGPDGAGNIDLTGTPFSVTDGFNVGGAGASGTATPSPDNKVIDLTGGGFCGWITPNPPMFNPFNPQPGNFVLTLADSIVATSTTLAVTPPSPAAAHTTETLTATVSPAAAGTVQFTDRNTPIGTPVTVTNGTASTTTTLPVGTHSLTAVFTPSDPMTAGPSTSSPVPYTVYATATRTTLTVLPNPAFKGLPVVLIAHVTPFTAAGTVQFNDGATPLGNPVPVTGGFAILTTSTLTTGAHALTAVFNPTNPVAFGPSTSPPVAVKVVPLP